MYRLNLLFTVLDMDIPTSRNSLKVIWWVNVELLWWLPSVDYIMFISGVHLNTLFDVSLCFPDDWVIWGHYMLTWTTYLCPSTQRDFIEFTCHKFSIHIKWLCQTSMELCPGSILGPKYINMIVTNHILSAFLELFSCRIFNACDHILFHRTSTWTN